MVALNLSDANRAASPTFDPVSRCCESGSMSGPDRLGAPDRRRRDEAPPARRAGPGLRGPEEALLALQASAGNHAVTRVIAAGRLGIARNGSDVESDEDELPAERPSRKRAAPRPAAAAAAAAAGGDSDESGDEAEPAGHVSKFRRTEARRAREPRSERLRARKNLEGPAAAAVRLPKNPDNHFWLGARNQMHWVPDRETVVAAVVEAGRAKTRVRQGTTECQCWKCKGWFSLAEIEVDHERDWATYVDQNASPAWYTSRDGHDFFGVPRAAALAAYNDVKNLRLLCGPDNAGKSGPKDRDKDDPPKHDPENCAACNPKQAPPARRGGGGGAGAASSSSAAAAAAAAAGPARADSESDAE
jgi:hypothetical protein